MTPEVQLALVNNLPAILGAIGSLVAAVAAVFGWLKSSDNHKAIKANDERTEEVGKAVNGRMSAFIDEMEKKNAATMAEAVKAARLDAENLALKAISELKAQISNVEAKEAVKALIDLETKVSAHIKEG